MIINYGLIAFTRIDDEHINILHFCGYEEEPTEVCCKGLEDELNIDPDFDLVGRINKDVFVDYATPEIVNYYTSKVGKIFSDD